MILLAHQGGWDEMALVILPLIVFAALLAMARRRVGSMGDVERPAEDTAADAGDD